MDGPSLYPAQPILGVTPSKVFLCFCLVLPQFRQWHHVLAHIDNAPCIHNYVITCMWAEPAPTRYLHLHSRLLWNKRCSNSIPNLNWNQLCHNSHFKAECSNPSLAQLLQTVHKPIGKDALLTYYFNFESVLATINNFFRLPSTSSEAKSNQPADPSFRKKNKTKLNLSAEPIIKLTQTNLQHQRC